MGFRSNWSGKSSFYIIISLVISFIADDEYKKKHSPQNGSINVVNSRTVWKIADYN